MELAVCTTMLTSKELAISARFGSCCGEAQTVVAQKAIGNSLFAGQVQSEYVDSQLRQGFGLVFGSDGSIDMFLLIPNGITS